MCLYKLGCLTRHILAGARVAAPYQRPIARGGGFGGGGGGGFPRGGGGFRGGGGGGGFPFAGAQALANPFAQSRDGGFFMHDDRADPEPEQQQVCEMYMELSIENPKYMEHVQNCIFTVYEKKELI